MHGYTGHGIYTATSPGQKCFIVRVDNTASYWLIISRQIHVYCHSLEVYKFIPTNYAEIKKPKAKMYEAGFIFAVQTKDTVEEILKW